MKNREKSDLVPDEDFCEVYDENENSFFDKKMNEHYNELDKLTPEELYKLSQGIQAGDH